jgi:hypothetical protein
MLRYVSASFGAVLDTDEDSALNLLFAVWRTLAKEYNGYWGRSPSGKATDPFMSKVNLTALNEFVFDRLKLLWEMELVDVFEESSVEDKVCDIASRLPSEFWSAKWKKLADNSAFKAMIKKDLETITDNVRKERAWYQSVNVLEQEVPDEDEDEDEDEDDR